VFDADHLHLLVAPERRDIIRFVDAFKSWTTRQAWTAGVEGGLWQPGMWDRTVRGHHDFEEVAMYIVRNPVNAGLAVDEAGWPHTWACWWESDTGSTDA
jgi:REP element-mobilizing transposase RayT